MKLLAVLCVLVPTVIADSPRNPLKKFTINLDLAPEERFVEIAKAHENYIKALLVILRSLFKGPAVDKFLAAAVVPDETKREMQGMADSINVTFRDAQLALYFYELEDLPGVRENLPPDWRLVPTRSCTGIVAQNSNGTMMMGRNQDYPTLLSPCQFDGTFVKGGKVVYEGTGFAGNVGIGGTCMVPGKFVAEINARGAGKPSQEEVIKSVAAGNPSFPLLLRQGCERGGSFEDAVNFYSGTDMILSGYITMAGAAPGEGAIVTRNASSKGTDVLRIEDGYPAEKPWFLVQTNYDHWKPAPKSDDRRDAGICLMEDIGPDKVDLDALWGVMSTESSKGPEKCRKSRGVYNSATIHTELVIPSTGEYHTYMRHNIIEEVVV